MPGCVLSLMTAAGKSTNGRPRRYTEPDYWFLDIPKTLPNPIRAGQDSVEHIWGFVQAQMSPQELDEFQRGQHLHWAPFFRDWPRLDQMIREAVDRGAYINPTFLYELGSLSALAAQHEQEDYLLYSNPRLMAYYPKNVAESLLYKSIGRSAVFRENTRTWF